MRGQRVDRALGCGHHSHAQRVDVPERAPDRRNRLADPDLRGISERHGVELVIGGIDLDQPNVVVDVPPNDLRRDPIPVLELDEQLVGGRDLAATFARVRDHVRVREDVALRRDDEARALCLLRGRALAAVDGVDGDHSRRARAVDPARIEAISHKWLRIRRDGGLGRGDGLGNRRRLDDDRLLRPVREPTGGFPDHEDRNAADHGGNDRDDRDWSGTLRHGSHCSCARSRPQRGKLSRAVRNAPC